MKAHTNQLTEQQQRDDAPPPIGHNNPPLEFPARRDPLVTDDLSKHLAEVYTLLLNNEIEPLAKRANAAPQKITSDEDLKIWADIAVDARKLKQKIDTLRDNEKKPFWNAGKKVDAFFNPTIERAGRIFDAGEEKATAYDRQKKADARAAQEAETRRLAEEAAARQAAAATAAEFGDDAAAQEHTAAAAAADEQLTQAQNEPPQDVDTRVRSDSGTVASSKTEWKFEIADYAKVDLNALRAFIPPKEIDKAVRALLRIQKDAAKVEGIRFYEEDKAQFRR